MNIFTWVKNNKLSSFLLVVVAVFILVGINSNASNRYQTLSARLPSAGGGGVSYDSGGIGEDMDVGSAPSMAYKTSSVTEESVVSSADRKVIQESNLSLQVKDVGAAMSTLKSEVESEGGFMVSSHLSTPQDAASGTLIVRVPAEKLESTLGFIRQQSIKVVSENLYGKDITDQYSDLEARLATLEKTKAKFEEIMNTATKTADILEVQRQLTYIQNQIDSVKGQQQYLDKSANMAKITIYLSTDEYSLPYTPSEAFRPAVIFKNAVRSLVGTLRGIAQIIIWIGVYAAVWVPVLVIIVLVKRIRRKRVISNTG